jgi:transposase
MKYVGIDVSKDKLDVFIRPDKKHFVIANNEAELIKLSLQLEEIAPELIAVESTGGYENLLVEILSGKGLKVARVNPLYIKNFAKSGGSKAKTDKLDSSIIAHYAEVYNPPVVILASDEERELDELITRRKQLIAFRTADQNRLKKVRGKIAKDIEEHIDWLDKRVKEIDEMLNKSIKESPELKKKEELLRSVPGVGEVLSKTILMQLPELGTLSNKKIASLVGLAPFNRDSGKYKGQMRIFGGRKTLRSAMYMPTWVAVKHNPVLKGFYERLIAKGKKPKVAITACMHKLLHILNSIIKHGIKWENDFLKNKADVLI